MRALVPVLKTNQKNERQLADIGIAQNPTKAYLLDISQGFYGETDHEEDDPDDIWACAEGRVVASASWVGHCGGIQDYGGER
jgi:hypothetical protein